MLVADALKYFNGNQSAMARASASSYTSIRMNWGLVVPWGAAWAIYVYTNGTLTVNLDFYEGQKIKKEYHRADAYSRIAKKSVK